MNRLSMAIVILAMIGLSLSVYSMAHKQAFVSGALCNINETFNCDIVNKGPYSEIAGIPVAAIGIIGYALIAVSAFLYVRHPEDKGYVVFLAISSTAGLGFSGYLTGIEAFVLKTWCVVCLTSQAVMLVIFLLSLFLLLNRNRPNTYVQESSSV